jgi:hypothetical protein
MPADIPDHVKAFIADHIDSVEQIDVLFILRRNPEREWTAEDVSRQLYTTPRSAANRLEALRSSEVAMATDGTEQTSYRYAPRTADLRRTIDDLEEAYRSHRSTVTRLIFSKPSDKIRIFTDAFRVKGDE